MSATAIVEPEAVVEQPAEDAVENTAVEIVAADAPVEYTAQELALTATIKGGTVTLAQLLDLQKIKHLMPGNLWTEMEYQKGLDAVTAQLAVAKDQKAALGLLTEHKAIFDEYDSVERRYLTLRREIPEVCKKAGVRFQPLASSGFSLRTFRSLGLDAEGKPIAREGGAEAETKPSRSDGTKMSRAEIAYDAVSQAGNKGLTSSQVEDAVAAANGLGSKVKFDVNVVLATYIKDGRVIKTVDGKNTRWFAN